MNADQTSASDLVGASPPFSARPVSIAVRDYISARRKETGDQGALGLMVAVSGGADSLALAVASADSASRMRVPLIARVVDHGMRDGSKQEAANVVAMLTELGIDVAVLSARDKAAATDAVAWEGLEGTARSLRHRALEEEAQTWAKRAGLSEVDILFGHTMDDQAETMMLRLARGASPDSMSAMQPFLPLTSFATDEHASIVQVNRGRPLLTLRRSDTEEFCSVLGLEPIQDPTNRADGPWRTSIGNALPRSAVRERVLPTLWEALGQDPTPALARLADLLAQDREALDSYAEDALSSATVEESSGRLSIDVVTLQGHPRAVRVRALRRAVARLGGGTPSATQAAELERSLWQEKNAEGSPRTVIVPTGVKAVRAGALLLMETVPR